MYIKTKLNFFFAFIYKGSIYSLYVVYYIEFREKYKLVIEKENHAVDYYR